MKYWLATPPSVHGAFLDVKFFPEDTIGVFFSTMYFVTKETANANTLNSSENQRTSLICLTFIRLRKE